MMNDPVNSPAHYTSGAIECIEAIEASMELDAFMGFLKGNCIKYLYRYENKNGVEDLKKCRWYLERLIKTVEEVNELVGLDVAKNKHEKEVAYDPDDYLAGSGCTDGYCPMPSTRLGPPEKINFAPVD